MTTDYCKTAAEASTDFEKTNTELKRKYILQNIMLYNYIVSNVRESLGTFGTGYPFYGLNPDLTGTLPIIEEQIRYNDELISTATACKCTDWKCAICIHKNYSQMKNLKDKCKPCTNIEDALKPRKLLNRLPDLDLWTVCHKNDIEEVKTQLTPLFAEHNMLTSDIDPLKTIKDMQSIATDLKGNQMPTKRIPLDPHIIDYETLYQLIEQTPTVIEQAIKTGTTPYLPIHPISLRKEWQYDDTPYNFIYDYLAALTEFNLEPNLRNLLLETRRFIAKSYSTQELYDLMIATASDPNKRRHKEQALVLNFERRIDSWKK